MTLEEVLSRNKSLRNSEKVVCSKCHEGIMKPGYGDAQTAMWFECDKCQNTIYFTPALHLCDVLKVATK